MLPEIIGNPLDLYGGFFPGDKPTPHDQVAGSFSPLAVEYEEFIEFLEEEITAFSNPLKFFHFQYIHTEDKNRFADVIKDLPLKQILFSLRSGKIASVEEGIASISSEELITEIKKRKKEFLRLTKIHET